MLVKILAVCLLVCAAMALTKAGKTPHCPTNWTPYKGRCYYCNATLTTQDDAERNCRSQNGRLASVHSVAEYNFIQTVVATSTKGNPATWLKGSFSHGTRISIALTLGFVYWSVGQPVCPAAPCCLVMNFGGDKKLGLLPCSNKMPFVCEK